MRHILVVLALAALGCPNKYGSANCTPLAQSCIHNQPYICSPNPTAWVPNGNLNCSEVHAVCGVVDGVAGCIEHEDAGTTEVDAHD